jgi:hypothetical protein
MQEVDRANLVPGKEYYLERPADKQKRIAKFEELFIFEDAQFGQSWHAWFSNFREINYKNDRTKGYRSLISWSATASWIFYEIASREVQKNMENRAYNMILLDIIKDEYFTSVYIEQSNWVIVSS